MAQGPLSGIKVVEMGTLIAGPYCARLLAEFGAEVVKIETPGEGDPHYQARGTIERHALGNKEVLLPGIVPKLSGTAGATRWIGPKLGEHTDEVLATLGYTEGEIAAMKKRGVVA